MTVRVEALTGPALTEALEDLGRLRIEVFREWPYLYDGTLAYERKYVARFAAAPGSAVIVARDQDRIVGAATAAPMANHADEFAAPFRARGYDIKRIFYFGESVLLAAYRGQGLGHAFFDGREAHARALGGFTHATFCAVVRPFDHPLRPADYRPLDAFWMKRGYAKIDGLVTTYAWKDIDRPTETEKTMQFWMREL